jgi:demethoxyubiquinone hydroxylase (CLK1/Coq7/Cat5 family)
MSEKNTLSCIVPLQNQIRKHYMQRIIKIVKKDRASTKDL